MKKAIELRRKIYYVFRVDWIESERGWGTRPDGCSLHESEADFKQYLAEYWATMPKEVPDEYSRPEGGPYQFAVNKKTYSQIKKSKNGIRLFQWDDIKPFTGK